MNLTYQQHIPADFHDNSRIWIFQSSRLFFVSEALEMEDMLKDFLVGWKSHGDPVRGFANLFFGQFIVLMADERLVTVGGCSTDSSVHFIQSIEQKFKVDMFNRQQLAFLVKDKIQLLPLVRFAIPCSPMASRTATKKIRYRFLILLRWWTRV